MDSAEQGVIYISWGNVFFKESSMSFTIFKFLIGSMIRAHTLPVEKRDAILTALSKFKQLVLWKWENETIPNQPDNVHIRKWMPQREILCK